MFAVLGIVGFLFTVGVKTRRCAGGPKVRASRLCFINRRRGLPGGTHRHFTPLYPLLHHVASHLVTPRPAAVANPSYLPKPSRLLISVAYRLQPLTRHINWGLSNVSDTLVLRALLPPPEQLNPYHNDISWEHSVRAAISLVELASRVRPSLGRKGEI